MAPSSERLNVAPAASSTLLVLPELSWLVKVKAVETTPAVTDAGPVKETREAVPALTVTAVEIFDANRAASSLTVTVRLPEVTKVTLKVPVLLARVPPVGTGALVSEVVKLTAGV